MSICGVICGMDNSFQSFETCIHAHETFSKDRNCNVPTASIKSQRDNIKYRKDAGISASTILSCARAQAIESTYDIYETVISGYNKFRGTLIHAMIEHDPDPPEWVIQEERIRRFVEVDGELVAITGKPDYVDPKYKVLIDFKSKHNLPLKMDPMHEAQFNIYRWLLKDGVFVRTNLPCHIDIDRIGAHYITMDTKPEKAWRKVLYPVWGYDEVEAMVIDRLRPLTKWKKDGILPECNRYVDSPYWKCDCERHAQQLMERGIVVE